MHMRRAKSQSGFTLLELLVASSIGLIVILAMTSLFKTGMDATFTVTQRLETQQNMRAAIELMTKDLSLAGAGLPSGGVQLVTGGTQSKFACNQTGTCYVPNNTYPNSGAGTQNYMYGIIPGFSNGVQNAAVIAAAPGQINDSLTAIYCDYNFPLSNFTWTFNGAPPTSATVGLIGAPNASNPTNILAPGGLQVGDLLLFVMNTPGNGKGVNGNSLVQNAAVVVEITGLPANTTVDFAAGDALNFNQNGGGTSNNLATAVGAGTQTTVCRLYAVTYFLQVPPAGGTVQTPRLMRQVNGLNAVPVADNIINLQFTYDVIDANLGNISANQQDPIGAGQSPGLIQKVNIWILGQSITPYGKRSQSMFLATSVSARDMSFCNSYSASTTVCQ